MRKTIRIAACLAMMRTRTMDGVSRQLSLLRVEAPATMLACQGEVMQVPVPVLVPVLVLVLVQEFRRARVAMNQVTKGQRQGKARCPSISASMKLCARGRTT